MTKFSRFLLLPMILLGGLFASCTCDVDLTLKKDGVDVKFSGVAGVAFEKMIRSATGVEDGQIVFDTNEISMELARNGFVNVKAVSKNGTDLEVTASDKGQSSPLFTSDIVKIENSRINASLSPDKLMNFYNSSDEQIVMFLDILLAPVFNDEVMTENEYLETITSFYGSKVSDEISKSSFNVSFTDAYGTKTKFIIPMTRLLTLNEVLELK